MNKRIAVSAALAAILALSAVGCGNTEGSAAHVSNEYSFKEANTETAPDFNSAAADFSAELFKSICSEDIKAGKNAFASPESVMLALGLAANGAGGDTLAQFEQVMGKGMKLEDINAGLAGLITKAKTEKSVEFDIANSIWVKNSDQITLKKSYAELCKERFDADSFLEPFDDGTVDKLNSWVKDKTKGMIDRIKDRFEADEVAVLMNAVAFDGKWSVPFDENNVTGTVFHSADGKEQECKMMHITEHTYISDENAVGFVKPYEGGRYAFMALLPNENTSLADYVQTLTGEKLLSLYNSRQEQQVITALPKFSFDWGGSIAESLKSMGLDKAFAPTADFTNMADTSTGQLYIGDVVHKTHIEVNSEGTKAAAVTEIELRCGGAMNLDEVKTVTLDRPFLFSIIDTETGLPVFMGAVSSIEK